MLFKWEATRPVRPTTEVNVGTEQTQIRSNGFSSVPTILRPSSTPPPLAVDNPLPFFQQQPMNTTSNTVSSMTVPLVNPENLTMLPPVQPSVTPTTSTQTSIPTSHVIPNLSVWTFPAPRCFPTVHVTIPRPVRGQVTSTSTNSAQHRIFYIHQMCQFKAEKQLSTVFCLRRHFQQQIYHFHSLQQPQWSSFPTFPATIQSTVPPWTPTAVTVQDLAQLLTAAKKTIFLRGNLSNITETHCSGTSGLVNLEVLLTQHHSRMMWSSLTYSKTLVTGKAKTQLPSLLIAEQCVK